MNKEWSRIVSLVSVATFVCAGILNAQVSSSKLRNYNAERNLLALNANAPAGTKSVRFTIDNMQVAELTDEYGIKTNTKPVWKTVIDPAWLDKGEHVLKIEAITAQGAQTLETRKIQGTKRNTMSSLSLTGAWDFAEASELPGGALEGDLPPAVASFLSSNLQRGDRLMQRTDIFQYKPPVSIHPSSSKIHSGA